MLCTVMKEVKEMDARTTQPSTSRGQPTQPIPPYIPSETEPHWYFPQTADPDTYFAPPTQPFPSGSHLHHPLAYLPHGVWAPTPSQPPGPVSYLDYTTYMAPTAPGVQPAGYTLPVTPPPRHGGTAVTIVLTPTRTQGRSKRKKDASEGDGNGHSRAKKRPRQRAARDEIEMSLSTAVFGVGPAGPATAPASPSPEPPVGPLGSLVRQAAGNRKHAAATDVWYFVDALSTVTPGSVPVNTERLSTRPHDAAFLRCYLCSLVNKVHTWQNSSGQTGAIREHLKKSHIKEWSEVVKAKKLKGWEELAGMAGPAPVRRHHEPYTQEGLQRRMVRWMVVDDQSLYVADNPEFRELLTYVGGPNFDKSDIPHRTKVRDLITELYNLTISDMKIEFKNALGRVSFTSDLWTDHQQRGFMAITMHFCAKDQQRQLVIRSRLGAFRYVRGSHSGSNLATRFFEVIEDMGLLHKLGMITLDNASNCGTMMESLEAILKAKGIPFCRIGNRIRCFPHVVNIAVQTGVRQLTDIPDDVYHDNVATTDPVLAFAFDEGDFDLSTNAALFESLEYLDALRADPVVQARDLVRVSRASQQRREEFQDTIKEGNTQKAFGDQPLPEAVLLQDVDTRWSSLYLMIDRVLELYQAVHKFLQRPRQDAIKHYALSREALEVLQDVREFLQAPHMVQEVLSAQKTPTLSMALPGYEKLIVLLRLLRKKLPRIAHGIDASIRKLEEYLGRSRETKIYVIAMVINPTMKIEWLRKNWGERDGNEARKLLRDTMLEFRRAARTVTHQAGLQHEDNTVDPSTSSSADELRGRHALTQASVRAARAQETGFARVDALMASLSAESIDPNAPATASSGARHASRPLTAEEHARVERQACEEDERVVEAELKQYEADGQVSSVGFNLLQYWEENEFKYPAIYHVALDVLPVQASAVPCERAFSASKETDTDRRSNLDVTTVEMLQVLKYGFREDRLTFTEGWAGDRVKMAHVETDPDGVPSDEIDMLFSQGRVDELLTLLHEARAARN